MSETRQEWAAHALGMRTDEVVNVVSRGDVHLATLHDRTRAVLTADGRYTFDVDVVDEFVTATTETEPVDVQPTGDPGQQPADPGVDDVVPDGPVDDVLAWVGSDVDRARRALVAEGERPKPRSGLTATLTGLVAPAGDGA
jgi:hypothetical protein